MNRDSNLRVSRGRGYFPGNYRKTHRYQEKTDASIECNEPKKEHVIVESVDGLSEPVEHEPKCSVEPPTNMDITNIMQSNQGEYFLSLKFFIWFLREIVGKRYARYGSTRGVTPPTG